MNILNLFKLSYYFNAFPNTVFKLFWPLVIVCTLILVATVVGHWYFGRRGKKWTGDTKFWWTHWINIGYVISIVGLLSLFFRYETIPYFNWRIWPALMVVGAAAWIGYLVYYRYRLLPKKQVDRETKKSLAYYFRRRRK